jgi:hypothetical protein
LRRGKDLRLFVSEGTKNTRKEEVKAVKGIRVSAGLVQWVPRFTVCGYKFDKACWKKGKKNSRRRALSEI